MWASETYDIALLQVPLILKTAELACGGYPEPPVGMMLQTLGNPAGLEFIRTWGRVASGSEQRDPWKWAFIADLTVAGGASGGPVYDTVDLKVQGIIVGIATQEFSMVPLTYVVPSFVVCNLLGRHDV